MENLVDISEPHVLPNENPINFSILIEKNFFSLTLYRAPIDIL